MPQVTCLTYRAALFVVAALLAACSVPIGTLSANAPGLASDRLIGQASQAKSGAGSLYISSLDPGGNGGVVVYSGNPLKYVREITKGIETPEGLAFNSHRQLAVANLGASTVTVYNATGDSPIRTLSSKWMKRPLKEAVSANDDLYISSRSFVNIFVNSRQRVTKKIHLGTAAIAIDSSNNVYIAAEPDVIDVFAPGATKPMRTISEGVDQVTSLAIDNVGNLYVGNAPSSHCGSVTVYNAATGTLENTITNGICEPLNFAFDAQGHVYVSNYDDGRQGSSVTVYSAGTGSLMETITKGINGPDALLVDPSGNLYVANLSEPSNVTVYAPNHTNPSQTLTKMIHGPADMKWLP